MGNRRDNPQVFRPNTSLALLAITFPLRGVSEWGRLCTWRGGKEMKTPAAYFLAPARAGAVAVSSVWNLPHQTVILVLSHSSVRGAW